MNFDRLLIYIYLVISLGFFAGCDGQGNKPLAIGDPFPAFTVSDLAGREVKVLAKNRATTRLISIRTLGCRFCESDFRELEKLYHFYNRDELDILVINVGFEKKDVADFLQDKTISFRVGIDKTMVAMKRTNISILPVAFLVGSDNKIISTIQGGFSFDVIKDIVENM